MNKLLIMIALVGVMYRFIVPDLERRYNMNPESVYAGISTLETTTTAEIEYNFHTPTPTTNTGNIVLERREK